MFGPSERRPRWRRLAPWYDALLLAGVTVAVVSWVLDRAADLDLGAWVSATCLVLLTLVLRSLTERLVA